MKIAASMLFDSTYIECALLTAYEVSQRDGGIEALHLIFLSRGGEEDAEARTMLTQFCATVQGPVRLCPIEVSNVLPDFKSYHFNNSIIYKALIPKLLPDLPYILNLDAGILLGREFDGYVQELIDTLCHADAQWVIAGNCNDAAKVLSPEQLQMPHHEKYAGGAVLFFNGRQYHASQWDRRYLAAYQAWHGILRYAEEELICLVSQSHELTDLPRKGQLKVHALGPNVLHGVCPPLPDDIADEGVYFKFMGSIKPWKYWVLDPDKAIYTRRRQRLEAVFTLGGRALIESQRRACLRPEWIESYQIAYDAYLMRDGHAVGKSVVCA